MRLESVHQLDGSFSSFVNPTEADSQEPFEVVFHNSALSKIIGEKGTSNLEAFSRLRLFHSTDFA